MANLFPQANNNIVPLDNMKKNTPIGYKRSLKFDDETGDFVRDGQNRIVSSSGIEAWKEWCIKCLTTERYAFSSYSTDFGINTRLIFSLPDRAAQELMLKKEITEALMADDYKRTQSVSNFEFNWFAADAVEVTCTVKGLENAEIDLRAKIGG
ncbi:DUF2634 domain-containing protein [Lachnospiraceae bacterium MD329]|nr:DUF2634 domain-containing protein [Lachnospiraceae bacterium MD329]